MTNNIGLLTGILLLMLGIFGVLLLVLIVVYVNMKVKERKAK